MISSFPTTVVVMVAKRGIDNGKTDINENQDRWTCLETVINEGYQNHLVPESAATIGIETVHHVCRTIELLRENRKCARRGIA